MDALLANGRLVDAILVLMVAEFLGLAFYRRASGRGPALLDLAINQFAGAFLLLALRCALAGAGAAAIAACLSGALAAHVADLARRWRRA